MKKILSIIAIILLAACSDNPVSSGDNGNGYSPTNRETEERGQYYHIENGSWCMEVLIVGEDYISNYPEDQYVIEAKHYKGSANSKTGKCPSSYSSKCRNSMTENYVYEFETKFTEESANQCETIYINGR